MLPHVDQVPAPRSRSEQA